MKDDELQLIRQKALNSRDASLIFPRLIMFSVESWSVDNKCLIT